MNETMPRREALALMAGSTLSTLGLGLGLGACGSVAGSGTRAVTTGYSEALRGALEAFTDRLPGYHYRSTPLGSFGVGSVYRGEVRGADLSRAEGGWYLGDAQSWLAAGLPDDKRSQWRNRIVSEGSFGPMQIDANRRRAIEARLGVAIIVALGINASLDFERGADVGFRASEVRNRRLNWAEFSSALDAGLVAREVAEAVRSDDFIIAAADVVLLDYRAEITVDETINPALGASLRAKTLQLRPKAGSFSGSIALRESTRGHFVAASSEPVVAAVLFKRPPPRPKDGSSTRPELGAWPAVDASVTSLDAVESRVLQSGR